MLQSDEKLVRCHQKNDTKGFQNTANGCFIALRGKSIQQTADDKRASAFAHHP